MSSKLVERRLNDFKRRCGKDGDAALQLAYHAAMPVALNPELLHFLRINFFLDPPEQLPYTVEFEFLSSGLCREIDAELYEIEPEIRNVLLQRLMRRKDASQRIRDIATLLWQYVEYYSPWADRVELERAQQLTALNFLDPAKAKQWLDEAEANASLGKGEREWFIAMRQEIEELPDLPDDTLDLYQQAVKTILILAANPTNTSRLQLDEEVREIDEGLRRANKREQFKLEQKWAVRLSDIRRAVLDTHPQIIHFSGHGAEDEGLAFEDETGQVKLVHGEALARLFELFADQVECVVFNGCYSLVQAEAIAQHINYVVGMSRAISDQAGIEFVVGFYNALGAGRSIEFAYQLGCTAIQLAAIPEHLTPVLLKKSQVADTLTQKNSIVETKPVPVPQPKKKAIEIFFFYAHEDENLENRLVKHLLILKSQGVIKAWYECDITAGDAWKTEIEKQLNSAQIILLLVSSDFLASDFCWSVELERVMKRHEARKARVIPIILRPVDWHEAPFAKLQALPKDAKPITSWRNWDQAFVDIAQGIRRVVEELTRTR